MSYSLGKKFSFFSLIKFAIPNVVMMIFLSMYTIVDGIFVSRYAGTIALSAVNMIYPTTCVQMALAIMLAAGSSAIIARKLGEGKKEEAKGDFSFIILTVFLLGISVAILGNLLIDQLVPILGASELQFEMCKIYGRILFSFAPAFFLQVAFQTLFVTAGNPTLGLITTIFAGITNIVLDYFFIAVCGMGIAGAALATGIGYCIPAIIGLIYFGLLKTSVLHFTKLRFSRKVILCSCTNGSSEMVTNLANAVTTFLFNYVFMKFYGEDGVASITIVLYFQFVFTALFFGYSMGVAPIISYKYGCGDKQQLKSIYRNSIGILSVCSILAFVISQIVISPAMKIFTEEGSNVYHITLDGFWLYSIGFLFMGISMFASSMFTAFSDGKVSAIISFTRTFLFLVIAILCLPILFQKTGVWLAVPVAEALGILISIFYLLKKKKIYHY